MSSAYTKFVCIIAKSSQCHTFLDHAKLLLSDLLILLRFFLLNEVCLDHQVCFLAALRSGLLHFRLAFFVISGLLAFVRGRFCSRWSGRTFSSIEVLGGLLELGMTLATTKQSL